MNHNKEANKKLLDLASRALGYARLPVEGWTLHSEKGMRLVGPDHEFVRYWNPLLEAEDSLTIERSLGLVARKGKATNAWIVSKMESGRFRVLAFDASRSRAAVMAAAALNQRLAYQCVC